MSSGGKQSEYMAGMFFFTTAGVMVQWNGKYLYSDAPQQVTPAPVVSYKLSDRPSSAFDIGKP